MRLVGALAARDHFALRWRELLPAGRQAAGQLPRRTINLNYTRELVGNPKRRPDALAMSVFARRAPDAEPPIRWALSPSPS